MRRATMEAGWLQLQESAAQAIDGFRLGYDFAAEHEWGTPYLKSALGIAQRDFPIGVEDRMMTQVPPALRFVRYEMHSKDRRVKRTMPAALLFCSDSAAELHARHADVATLAKALDVSFWFDFADRRVTQTDDHQIVSSWSDKDGFAIHVRGAENVARLESLHEAFLRKDIALADASVVGFERKSLALVVASAVPDDVRAQVRDDDAAHFRLHQAFKECGIVQLLHDAGLGWYSLRPAWERGEGSDLIFFLNPENQKENAYGWFTLDELHAWARGEGPVVESLEVSEHLKQCYPDWEDSLANTLAAAGVNLRCRHVYQWMDKEHTKPGVRLLTAPGSPIPSGVYSVSELQAKLQASAQV